MSEQAANSNEDKSGIPTWAYILGGAALLLMFRQMGDVSVRKAVAADLVTDEDLTVLDTNLETTSISDFKNLLTGMDSFNDMVTATSSMFESDEDKATQFILVSGFLDGLSVDKIMVLADMYAIIMTEWITTFGNMTTTYMTSNASMYDGYRNSIRDLKQCKKSSVHYSTTETNTHVETSAKANVLGGILFGHKRKTSTDIKQLIKTPVPICSQWGVDEAGALALVSGMSIATKANYLAWLTSLSHMPTMLDAIGI